MSGISKYKFVALDSNIFIYHFENNPKFTAHTNVVFKKLIDGSIYAVTSVNSVIETLSFPLPDKVVREIEEAFKTTPNLNIAELNHEIAYEAASIRRRYKSFKLPDAVQLATALNCKAQTFITNDKRLKVFKELPITLLTEI